MFREEKQKYTCFGYSKPTNFLTDCQANPVFYVIDVESRSSGISGVLSGTWYLKIVRRRKLSIFLNLKLQHTGCCNFKFNITDQNETNEKKSNVIYTGQLYIGLHASKGVLK